MHSVWENHGIGKANLMGTVQIHAFLDRSKNLPSDSGQNICILTPNGGGGLEMLMENGERDSIG